MRFAYAILFAATAVFSAASPLLAGRGEECSSLHKIIQQCERCARTGIEGTLHPDLYQKLKEEHTKSCNSCLDKIVDLL